MTGSLHASIGPYWAKRLGHGGEATNGSAAKPAQELRCRCAERNPAQPAVTPSCRRCFWAALRIKVITLSVMIIEETLRRRSTRRCS